MTYGELKSIIKTLGFEENESLEEYKEILINGCNNAISIIYETVLPEIESYFKFKDPEWEMPVIIPITEDTTDEFEIQLPDKVRNLIYLLAAYFMWLDDDERKAIIYYNMYEDLKSQIFTECSSGSRARIVGGFSFG